MRNIRAAVAAALVVAMMTGCGSTPAETGGSAPAAASQAGSDVSSAASGFEEDASPAQTPESTLPEDPSSAAGTESAVVADDGIRPEFQQAMDSYEAFFDEYCDFMRRYSESDGTDLAMLADYAKIMERYAQVTSDFSNWDSDELSDAEFSLYLEVQTRVNQKLLELSA